MTNLIGKVLGAGRYRIDRELGSGGQGTVYKGTHLSLNIPVAIKVLSFTAAGDYALQTRFKREAQRTASLRHPNIVTVHDYAFEEGMYYIVSDFIDGTDLKKLLKANPGPMPLDRVAKIVRQVADGLDYAHRRNIIHRDIKPGNILIEKREERVVLVDFGLARMMEDEELSVTSERGGMPGTPAYMSPEQIVGNDLDQRTDVYSVGVVVYEMVTGQNPFRGEHDTSASILYKQVHETPAPPQSIVPSLPPSVDTVLLKALAKAPEERYQSAGKFAAELERAIPRPRRAARARVARQVRCAKCGASVPAGTRFCGACGAPMTREGKRAAARAIRRQPAPARTRPAPVARTAPPPRRPSTGPRTAPPPPRPRTGPRTGPPAPRRTARTAAVRARPPSTAAGAFEYKSVGPRLAAAVIDSVLAGAAAGLIVANLLAGILTDIGAEFGSDAEYVVIAELVSFSLLIFAYYVLFEGLFKGTLGKLILGMRVVETNGRRVGIGRAFFRNLLRIIDFLPVAYLLGIILVASSDTKQRVGDRIAGTYVVARKSLPGR